MGKRGDLVSLTAKREKIKIDTPVESEPEEMPQPAYNHEPPRQVTRPTPQPRQVESDSDRGLAPVAEIPTFEPNPQLDLFRHTFYARGDQIDTVKFIALVNKRKQSELIREALDDWIHKVKQRGFRLR